MGYFRELPNVDYQSFLSDSLSSQSYITVKNLFRRNKLRDDLSNVFTIFNKYEIPEGSRPELVAEEFYGKADLDWVVLLTAGILNVRDEWPLSNYHLYRYAENLYGIDGLNDVRYYETKEVKDSSGRLILPKEKVVDSNFTIPDPDDYRATLNPVRPVTNWEYEIRKNNQKSSIYLLRREYLQQFLNDMRQIMIYDRSSEYVSEDLIRTENTRVTIPQ
jgi:hypothetical protein